VREAVENTSGVVCAVKTIDKRKVMDNLHKLRQEAAILLTLDHPNLIKAYVAYEDTQCLHIVTELCTGGELMERLASKAMFNETSAAKVLLQILLAVDYLHKHGICHRDLKPSNFLFTSPHKDAQLKLIDFGLANRFRSQLGVDMKSTVGTPYYLAPEVLSGGSYGPQCDMWSIGVIMYWVLSGSLPFSGSTANDVYKHVQRAAPSFSEALWSEINDDAKSLVMSLLEKVPTSRPTAARALKNRWLLRCCGQQCQTKLGN
jgi:calcium-dependent protein kinase